MIVFDSNKADKGILIPNCCIPRESRIIIDKQSVEVSKPMLS